MNLQDRLKEYLKSKNLTFKDFEILCELSNGTAARLRDTTRKSTFDRIANKCDLNINWLKTGEGEMLNDNGGFQEVPDEEVVNLNPKPFEKVTLVPLINIDSVGGMSHTNDVSWREQYTVRHIPFTDARPDDVAIYQSGDSMSPGIPSGSILHIRQVHDWQEYFGYGDTFVLWLKDERRITKQVLKYREDPKNYVTCHSFNPAFEDEELPKKFIRQVWKVITVLSDKGW